MGKVRPRSRRPRSGRPAKRSGWAGIRGRPRGRAAPGSRPAHGVPASASAVRTRIHPARGGGRVPLWPRARGWRRAWGWRSRGWRSRGWRSRGWRSRGWRSRGWRSRGWRSRGWRSRGWRSRGWRLAAAAVRAGTILREAPRRARNGRQRLARPRLARLRFAPRGRRPVPGVGSEPSGPAARTKGAQGSPSRPSGTGLYAAVLPPARNHYDDSHSTGHFLYSSQTPVQAHFLAKRPSVPILAVSRPYGMARGLMLPIESKRVQRAIFR